MAAQGAKSPQATELLLGLAGPDKSRRFGDFGHS